MLLHFDSGNLLLLFKYSGIKILIFEKLIIKLLFIFLSLNFVNIRQHKI